MSKIVFFCIPAHGHTNPTLGVVRELISRGHEVWYYSYNLMRTKIEESGAHSVACDEYDPQTKLTPDEGERIGKGLVFSTNLIADMTLALDDAIMQDMLELKPDVIVADSMAYWGKLIARKLKIPFVSSTTTFAFNRYSSKVMKGSTGGLFSMLFAMPRINKSLNRLRVKGYRVKSILDIIANDNDTNTIVYTVPEFQPCAETFSDKYAFVGASMRPITEPIEKADVPTVYISLGTVMNQRPDFYKNCIAAFKDYPYRIIMVFRWCFFRRHRNSQALQIVQMRLAQVCFLQMIVQKQSEMQWILYLRIVIIKRQQKDSLFRFRNRAEL